MAAASEYWFDLRAVLHLGSLENFIEHLRYAVHGFEWPPLHGFASPSPNTPKLKRALDPNFETLLGRVLEVANDPGDVTFGFGKLSSMTWGQRPDKETIYLSLSLSPLAELFADPAGCVRGLTHVARRLLERGVSMTAAVERLGDAETCIPFVPLAKTRRPLVVTTAGEVAAEYDHPDDFWAAGWTIETFGECRLLTRCQDVVTKRDVLREIRDHQWQMARASRPRRTKYGHPTVTDEERPIYEEGEPRIYPVGRHSETGVVEYSCVLEPGQHLHGWEIFYLRSLTQNKKMQDGTPITAVQVVFLEPWMAHAEKRPLLDNDVLVFYEDVTTGENVAVTE